MAYRICCRRVFDVPASMALHAYAAWEAPAYRCLNYVSERLRSAVRLATCDIDKARRAIRDELNCLLKGEGTLANECRVLRLLKNVPYIHKGQFPSEIITQICVRAKYSTFYLNL